MEEKCLILKSFWGGECPANSLGERWNSESTDRDLPDLTVAFSLYTSQNSLSISSKVEVLTMENNGLTVKIVEK